MTPQTHRKVTLRCLALAVLASAPLLASAATTNWAAYNDHNRGAGTAPNVSTYSPANAVGTLGGPLTNFTSGEELPVGVSIAVVGSTLNGATGGSVAPNAGTPADLAFGGKVEWADSAFYFCASPYTASFTITFTNLDAAKKYVFKGVPQRGIATYATRWGSYMLVGAASATPAHEQGPGSLGVVTNGWSPYGDLLAPSTQVAINCGNNLCGDMIVWTDIIPNGTSFSVVSSNWLAATPGGAANTTYAYAINAFSLEEVEAVTTPIAIVTEPVGTNVIKFRPFSLRVQATGSAPQYQWHKVGTGPIGGATSPIYSVAEAQLTDTGDYYVVVQNSLNSVQSVTVHVEVLDDNTPPTILGAVGSADFREITVQFSEKMNASGFDIYTFEINPGLSGIIDFRMTNNNTVIVLTTVDPAAQDTTYTVTIADNLTDLAGNSIPRPGTVQFKSWVSNPFGGVVFQVYTNLSITDNSLAQLTNNINFPYNPAATYSLSNLNSREVYDDDTHDGYGGRFRTLFIPAYSGQYRFFIRSDDSSQLYLNPNGTDPAGKIPVANVGATCCLAFQEPPSAQTTVPFDLVAGRGYYVEALYKEGTGGDYCLVAARLEGDLIPAASLTNLMDSSVGAMAVPAGIVGTMSITQQPTNTTVEEPASATFSVTAATTLGSPFVYQWQKSDDAGASFVDVPNATESRYTTGPLVAANDHQDQYRVIVKSPAGQLTSAALTLTVGSDVTAPRLVSAVGSTNLGIITLTYSEAVDDIIAGDAISYTLTGPGGAVIINLATVLNAPPTPGVPTIVELQTDPRVFGLNYTVTMESGILPDISANANLMVAPYNSAIVSATGTLLPFVLPWSYNALGAPGLGTAWKEPGYNDTSWPVSNALFVAKNGTPGVSVVPLNALIPMTGTNGAQVITYYFRTHFELSAYPSNVSDMVLNIVVDDGAVVYLNGQQLYSIGMPVPPPPITYDTLATVTGGNDYLVQGPFSVPVTNLLYGDNVLAVEVHQAATTSSDMAFAMELSAQVAKIEPPRSPVITTQPVGGTANEGQSFTFSVQANGAPPLTYQWHFNNTPIVEATNSTYLIASVAAANQGEYYVVVDNPAASPATSDKVQLVVNSDSVRPTVVSAKGGPATNITVVVTFSETMAVAPAEILSNYELTGPGGITIVGAVASGNTVTLTLSGPRQADVIYTLTVKDLTDAAFNPNILNPNPTILPVATVVELVSINGQSWKYLQQTVDGTPAPCLDGTPWTESGYDDSGWQSGPGVFYGLRDPIQPYTATTTLDGSAVSTFLNVFTNGVPANGIQQTNFYFRTTFNLPSETTNGATLLVHSMVDDGAVFYLNGNRVGNVRYTADPAYCTNFASASGNQSWEPALASPGRVLGLTGLVTGQNTLAVQVAQNNGTSSDVTFGLLLEADVVSLVPPVPTAPVLGSAYVAGTQTLTLNWSAAGYRLEAADTVTGAWLPVGGASSPWPVSTAIGSKFYRLHKP